MKHLEEVDKMIHKGAVDEAICRLQEILSSAKDDYAFYLMGNASRKKGDFQNALNCYLEAMAINPQSPAKEAHQILMNILEFYHKDLYNP